MSEANDITAQLLIAIQKRYGRNVLCWRNNTGRGYGFSVVQAAIQCMKRGDVKGALAFLRRPIAWGVVGSADILVVLGPHSRLGGIECKAGADRQSPGQKAWAERVTALGGFYIIAHDVEGAMEELDRLHAV